MTLEEKEDLAIMMQGAGWEAFEKMMQEAVKQQIHRVMTYNLNDGPDGLVHAKARAEGAEQLAKAIILYKGRLMRNLK